MAFSLNDVIKQSVNAAAGNVQIPAAVKNQVLGGLSDSILGSLTQTAAKAGGIELIKDLFGGKTSAANSPITDLAGKLFTNNILKNLNLGSVLNSSLTGIIPTAISGVTKLFKDQNGDGKVDINDIIIALGKSSIGKGLLKNVLGGLFKK